MFPEGGGRLYTGQANFSEMLVGFHGATRFSKGPDPISDQKMQFSTLVFRPGL